MGQATERHWQFNCPECGFGSIELRCLAADHEIHCEVCLNEQGRVVVLRRWITADVAPCGDAGAAS